MPTDPVDPMTVALHASLIGLALCAKGRLDRVLGAPRRVVSAWYALRLTIHLERHNFERWRASLDRSSDDGTPDQR